jgi:hypothetical protein
MVSHQDKAMTYRPQHSMGFVATKMGRRTMAGKLQKAQKKRDQRSVLTKVSSWLPNYIFAFFVLFCGYSGFPII